MIKRTVVAGLLDGAMQSAISGGRIRCRYIPDSAHQHIRNRIYSRRLCRGVGVVQLCLITIRAHVKPSISKVGKKCNPSYNLRHI